jgi:hypothetical protein
VGLASIADPDFLGLFSSGQAAHGVFGRGFGDSPRGEPEGFGNRGEKGVLAGEDGAERKKKRRKTGEDEE